MKKLCIGSAGIVVALGGVLQVHAQTESAADLQLEEVVVTATKRETNLQKTPISIQTYSGEELRTTGKKRIDEIMNGIVGVAAQDSQVGVSFTIRGVASVEGGPPGGSIVGSSIPVVIDGVTQSRGEVVRGGTLDLAQVEVMRGPQSTNVGSGAMAGAVSLVTNKPVFEYQANGLLEVGNYNLRNMEGVMNLPITDNQALRFAFSENKRDGYISSGAGESDLTNMRVKYRWQASDDLDIILTAAQNHIGGNGVQQGVLLSQGRWVPWTAAAVPLGYSVSSGPPGSPSTFTQANGFCAPNGNVITMGCTPSFYVQLDGSNFRTRADAWDDGFPADSWPNNPFRDTTINSYNLDMNWNLGFATLTVQPSVESSHFRSMEPPRGTSFMSEDVKQDTRQLEARLTSNADSALTWAGGVYYYHTNRYGGGLYNNGGASIDYPGGGMGSVCGLSGTTPVANPTLCYTYSGTKYSKQDTFAPFANFTYNIMDSLRVSGGLRYSSDKKAFVSSAADVTGTAMGPSAPFTWSDKVSGKWSATTYNAGIQYDVFDETMLYLNSSTGYQPGSVSAMGGTVTTNPALKLEQLSLGLKSRFLDNRLQLNIEAFNSTYKNRAIEGTVSALINGATSAQCPTANAPPGTTVTLIASTSNPNCAVVGQNAATAPKLLSRGIDIDLNYLITADDRLDFSVEYLKAGYNSRPTLSGIGTRDITAADINSAAGGTLTTAQELADSLNGQLRALGSGTLQNSPKFSLNTTYGHTFHLGGGSTLAPRLNWVYKTQYWSFGNGPGANVQEILAFEDGDTSTAYPTSTSYLAWQRAYSKFDGYLNWQSADGRYSVNGYMKNINNKVILTNYGGSYVSLDAPRTFGLIVQGNFK